MTMTALGNPATRQGPGEAGPRFAEAWLAWDDGAGRLDRMTTLPIWHPFTQHGLGEAVPPIVSASGARLAWDACRLDGLSSRWTIAHGNPRLTAIAHQRAAMDDPA